MIRCEAVEEEHEECSSSDDMTNEEDLTCQQQSSDVQSPPLFGEANVVVAAAVTAASPLRGSINRGEGGGSSDVVQVCNDHDEGGSNCSSKKEEMQIKVSQPYDFVLGVGPWFVSSREYSRTIGLGFQICGTGVFGRRFVIAEE
jgi:hypothetical protein